MYLKYVCKQVQHDSSNIPKSMPMLVCMQYTQNSVFTTVLCRSAIQWKGGVAMKCLIQLWYMTQRLSVYIVTLTAAHSRPAKCTVYILYTVVYYVAHHIHACGMHKAI